jgi:hypothetical protein
MNPFSLSKGEKMEKARNKARKKAMESGIPWPFRIKSKTD